MVNSSNHLNQTTFGGRLKTKGLMYKKNPLNFVCIGKYSCKAESVVSLHHVLTSHNKRKATVDYLVSKISLVFIPSPHNKVLYERCHYSGKPER